MTELKWLNSYEGQTTDELLALVGEYRADSLIVAFEAALLKKAHNIGQDKLSLEEKTVIMVEALEREVNNGGFDQFFANSSALQTAELIEALKRLGCAKAAEITQQAIDVLEIGEAPTAEAINRKMAHESEERDKKLGECDNRFYDEVGDLASSLLTFIQKNREKIKLK